MANSLEDLTKGCRNETITNASNVHQIFPLVNTNDERVESGRTRNVSAYDELLAPIYAVLYPRAGSFSSFVKAVLAFPDDTFQLLLPDSGEHVIRRNLELFRDADVGRTYLQKRFHQLTAFAQRQSRKVAVVTDKEVENEVVNTGCFAAKVLEQIEIWSA